MTTFYKLRGVAFISQSQEVNAAEKGVEYGCEQLSPEAPVSLGFY